MDQSSLGTATGVLVGIYLHKVFHTYFDSSRSKTGVILQREDIILKNYPLVQCKGYLLKIEMSP